MTVTGTLQLSREIRGKCHDDVFLPEREALDYLRIDGVIFAYMPDTRLLIQVEPKDILYFQMGKLESPPLEAVEV